MRMIKATKNRKFPPAKKHKVAVHKHFKHNPQQRPHQQTAINHTRLESEIVQHIVRVDRVSHGGLVQKTCWVQS